MKDVYIRVDGNEIIATGHIMRCLSIAEKIREQGGQVTFVVADARPRELIERRNFKIDVLDTVWNDLNQEMEILLSYIKTHHVERLLVDTYYVTEQYLKAISEVTDVLYVDDLNRFLYPVQKVLNYSIWAFRLDYEKYYGQAGYTTRFLLGSSYIPLRKEFEEVHFEVRKQVSKVLITTGGTDLWNVAGGVLERVLSVLALQKLEYHVVVGLFNENRHLIQRIAEQHSNVILHENVTEMAPLMEMCDVAVSASGSTLYELCACGVPTICLEIADNQEGSDIWEREGVMYYAGNAYKDRFSCLNRVVDCLERYINDYQDRSNKSVRMCRLVDAKGATRIANELLRDADSE